MSSVEFKAGIVSLTEQDGACIIGLADDPAQPSQWLVLQRALLPDEQDKKLGLDTYDFELSGEPAQHDSIDRVSLDGLELLLELRANKGLDFSRVRVNLEDASAQMDELAEKLRFVFAGTNTILLVKTPS